MRNRPIAMRRARITKRLVPQELSEDLLEDQERIATKRKYVYKKKEKTTKSAFRELLKKQAA